MILKGSQAFLNVTTHMHTRYHTLLCTQQLTVKLYSLFPIVPDREQVERRRLSRTGLEATPLIPPAAQSLPATKPSVQNTAQINNTQPAATMLC